jgi:hypothetical protein
MAAEDLDAALAKSAQRVVRHMNEDHADSLLAYAHFFGGIKTASKAQMTGLSSQGFELDVMLPDGSVQHKVLIRYTTPLTSAAQVRKVAVAMHFAAFNGLGFRYKLKSGFYLGALRQAWSHMPTGARMAAASVGILGLSVLVTRGRRLWERRIL